jgi:hypothetical protein
VTRELDTNMTRKIQVRVSLKRVLVVNRSPIYDMLVKGSCRVNPPGLQVDTFDPLFSFLFFLTFFFFFFF